MVRHQLKRQAVPMHGSTNDSQSVFRASAIELLSVNQITRVIVQQREQPKLVVQERKIRLPQVIRQRTLELLECSFSSRRANA